MSFIHLEQLIGVQIWILVVEADHNSDMDKVRIHVVEKRSSIHMWREGPVDSVLYSSSFKVWIAISNPPNLLQANTVMLETCAVFFKLKIFLDSLSKWAPAAFRENCLLCLNLYARLVSIFLGSVFCNTKISSDHSTNTAIVIVDYLISSNSW